MLEWLQGAGEITAALFSIFGEVITGNEPDFFPLRTALRAEAAWLWGLLATIIGGVIVAAIYRFVPFVERNLEPTVMVVSYLTIGTIIFVEVIRRFVFSEQFPWSTTIPGYLFLIMTWTGCSYNVKLRTHLSFTEFRTKMAPTAQVSVLILDAALWLGICWLVVVTSTRVVANAGSNFMFVTGTNNVFVWWFLISLPIAFILLAGRVFQNLWEDIRNYRQGNPMIGQTVLGGQ